MKHKKQIIPEFTAVAKTSFEQGRSFNIKIYIDPTSDNEELKDH